LVFSLRIGDLSPFVYLVELLWFSPFGIGDLSPFVGGRNGLNKIDKMAKVTNTGGRKPKGLNKIDKLAKVTYTVGRKPKELKKIEKLAKVGNTGGRNP
jgi:hypothetical protein